MSAPVAGVVTHLCGFFALTSGADARKITVSVAVALLRDARPQTLRDFKALLYVSGFLPPLPTQA